MPAEVSQSLQKPEVQNKPGIRTTEFWLVVALNLVAIVGATASLLPPKYAVVAITVSNSLYAVGRSAVKIWGLPIVVPDQQLNSTIMKTASLLILCSIAVFLFGCSGMDQQFRQNVDSVSVGASGSSDPNGGYSGSVSTTIHLRNPNSGLKK